MTEDKWNTDAGAPAIRALEAALWILVAYFFAQLLKIHMDILLAPGPLDPRESQSWMFSDLLQKGMDPFADRFVITHVNLYGVGQALFTWPLSRILGASLLVERIMAAMFIYMSAFMLYLMARHYRLSALTAALATLAWAYMLVNSLAATGKPDAIAIFFHIAGLAIPLVLGFSTVSLVLAGLLATLALFTKIYLVIGPLLAIGYVFLFVDRGRAVIGGLAFVVSTMVGGWTIYGIAPRYFDLTFGPALAIGAHAITLSPIRSLLRLYYVVENTWPVWLGATAVTAAALAGWRVRHLRDQAASIRLSRQIFSFRGPIVSPMIDYSALIFLASLCVSFYLQMHQSGGRNYYYQILLPAAFLVLPRLLAEVNYTGEAARRTTASVVLALTLVVISYTGSVPQRNFTMFPRSQDTGQWHSVEKLLAGTSDVLHTSEIAHIVDRRGLPVYNTGSAEFFTTGVETRSDAPARRAMALWQDFVKSIEEKVTARRFDIVMTRRGQGNFAERELIEAHYRLDQTIDLRLGFYDSTLEIWRPR